MAIPPYQVHPLHTAAVANADGREIECGDYDTGSIQVVSVGAMNADIQVQVSNNGTIWADQGAAINAVGITDIANIRTRYIRAPIQNYVGGTISVTLVIKALA